MFQIRSYRIQRQFFVRNVRRQKRKEKKEKKRKNGGT